MALARLPHDADNALPEILAALEIPMPPGSHILRAAGKPFASSGYRRSEAQVDEALSKSDLSIGDRLAVKLLMQRHQLLGT
jgi:hypothetical protein